MSEAQGIVALIGLRCSGKSSVGRRLALLLARPFVDLDVMLAERFAKSRELDFGPSAGEILSKYGEARFRDLEEATLAHVIEHEPGCVLATGGGVVERESNRTRLREHATCVWLQVELAELERRLRADHAARPPLTDLDPAAELAVLALRRNAHYRALADLELDCGRLATQEVAVRIAAWLADHRPPP